MNSKDRVTNNLVALGSAAVLAVYAAGFARTREAAARFAHEASERRPRPPAIETAAKPAADTVTVHRAAPVVQAVAKPASRPPAKPDPKPSADRASRVAVSQTSKAEAGAHAAAHAPDSSSSLVAAKVPGPAVARSIPMPDSTKTANVPVPADSIAQAADTAHTRYKDGVYFGWGTSRHGDIQAGLEVKNGRIISAFINECLTQYSCSWISALPPQVIARQSAEVDYVSGATQSANAFYYAVIEALKRAK